jgi:tRNA G18 (ribose-2'-O)-methylase SpoU
MHIYKQHLLGTINDSRVVFELVKTVANDEICLIYDLDSEQKNIETLIKNIRYHNPKMVIASTKEINQLKNYKNQKGLLLVCGKTQSLKADSLLDNLNRFIGFKILGLCC